MNPQSSFLNSWMTSLGVIKDPSQFATREQEVEISRFIKTCQSVCFDPIPLNRFFAFSIGLRVRMLKTQVRAERSVEEGRKFLLQRNALLIVKFVRKYGMSASNWDDLAQAGCDGFNRGLDLFDPDKDFRLSTFVYWWIRQAIQKEVQKNSRTITLPMHLYETKNKIDTATAQFHRANGYLRKPTTQELSVMTGIEVERIRIVSESFRNVAELDRPFPGNNEGKLLDLIQSDEMSATDKILSIELKSVIRSAMDELPEFERDIISFRFGFHGKPFTYPEIGRTLEMDQEKVKSACKKATSKLNGHNAYKLRAYAKSFLS